MKDSYLKRVSVLTLSFLLVLNFAITGLIFTLFILDIFRSTSFLIITSLLCFISMSVIVNELTRRMMDKKYQAKFVSMPYEASIQTLIQILKDNKANEVTMPYATSYLLIKDKCAYKFLFVTDNEGYFGNKEVQSNSKGNKKLEECTKFYGFEIFVNVDNIIIKKLQQYTFQSDKIFYTAFYELEDKLVQAHYEEPLIEHKDNFENILKLMEMKKYDS